MSGRSEARYAVRREELSGEVRVNSRMGLPTSAACNRCGPPAVEAQGSTADDGMMAKAKHNPKLDPKGHQAASPMEMPKAAWKDIASRTWQRVWDDNVGLVAAGVAFYAFFALLSLLAMIVLVYGLMADVKALVDTMRA